VALAASGHTAGEIAQGLENVRSRSASKIALVPDDRILSFMAYRVFCAGFSRKQIGAKWPAFEEAL
jgi:3-methyladenine DNA glycosylase Tag